ncbi:DUF1499 domain-containing protein [Erythrobacter sp. NE805]|uniref:DUF1499 domain-containing protein n=1 Tax=Erythrobacter sp. NE805 TaxID=3389875 RepID=UPI00396B0958
MMNTLPRHAKILLVLLVLLPIYFAIASFGTKIGLWGWKFGLVAMTLGGGVVLLGLVALAALVSLVMALRAKPRRKGLVALAILGLLVPASALLVFVGALGKGQANPIHDISTDTANPPAFSASTMAAREAAGANPLSDYQTPLGQLAFFKDKGLSPELAVKSHAQIITDRPDRPAPLPLGGASKAEGVAAVAAAMGQMGLTEIRSDPATGIVEGVAETFWFGFKDDIVARVGDAQIDFRSVSRVGVSDLGANTARILALREKVQAQLGAASR